MEVFERLKENLIRNLYKNYEKTGYLWEFYDPETGKEKDKVHLLGGLPL